MKLLVPLVSLIVVLGVGCRRRAEETHLTSAPAPDSGPSIVEPVPTTASGQTGVNEDRAVAEMVRSRILADPALENQVSRVRITVLGPTATLRGTVKTEDVKQRVEQAARAVSNIQYVDNQLVVPKP